ncbi:glycosyltransferase family 2 protein [Mariniflexile sp. AS56]|uniref:glycosyltransferase family 2 protein n=1 Tax=Mariniflexile sp. AS56 TaxID=3063957 RepID=UPI0026F05C79|nr:galactosyltransferase-related protein [Mariniflexile sp. AS56]MDO7172723.1 glycosyltransferase [Mariniflexile sp. AS56]
MITIVLTYRNRDLNSVETCLNSLKAQTNSGFEVVFVDYGSQNRYKVQLNTLVQSYNFVKLLRFETEQQLWCKSKAINMVLKQTDTPYFFVGDVDMIYHPNFIETLDSLKQSKEVVYFQVGFLGEEESRISKEFDAYKLSFKSNAEATGMTLFNTKILKSINGYDEFYHGWGAEDTDVHMRLNNAGYNVSFYTDSILMLHQWHPKHYREVNDLTPFHSSLEQINHQYLELSKETKRVKANENFNWGVYRELDYLALKSVDLNFKLTNKEAEIKAFISNVLLTLTGKVLTVAITHDVNYNSIKQKTKKLLGKKTVSFLTMQIINNILLECIVNNLRTNAYILQYNSNNQTIHFTIKL